MMRSLNKQRGVFSIEFGLGAIVLFFITFAMFEMCRFIFLANQTEMLLRESARDSRVYHDVNGNTDFQQRFQQMIALQGNLWHLLIDNQRYSLRVVYYQSYNAMLNNKSIKQCVDCPFALYSISYYYTPILHIPGFEDRQLQRSILMVQEHEGW